LTVSKARAVKSRHRSFDGTPYRCGGGLRHLAPKGEIPPPGQAWCRAPTPLTNGRVSTFP